MSLFGPKHGLGYKPDAPDERDTAFRPESVVNVMGLSRLSMSMRGMAPVQDQGATSSCVGHAIRTAIVIREKLAGVFPVVEPSRLALYFNARMQHGARWSDGGTYIRDAMKCLAKIGVCDETLHPFAPTLTRVVKQPPARAYIEGHGRSGGRYMRLSAVGDERVGEIRNALALGLPVVFGTNVDKAFQQHTGNGVLHRPQGATLGGHAMCIVGDDTQRDAFTVQNSWGTGWGDGGFVALHYDWFADYFGTRDLWVVDGWKRIQRAA